MRTHRPRRRLLCFPQALSQCGLLHRPYLSIHGFPGYDVPGAVRDSAHERLDRPVGGDAARSGAENCASPPGVSRIRPACLSLYRTTKLILCQNAPRFTCFGRAEREARTRREETCWHCAFQKVMLLANEVASVLRSFSICVPAARLGG